MASKYVFPRFAHIDILVSVMEKVFGEVVKTHTEESVKKAVEWLTTKHPEVVRRKSVWEAVNTVLPADEVRKLMNLNENLDIGARGSQNRHPDLDTFIHGERLCTYNRLELDYIGGSSAKNFTSTIKYSVLRPKMTTHSDKANGYWPAHLAHKMSFKSPFPVITRDRYNDDFYLSELSPELLAEWAELVKPINEKTIQLVKDMNTMEEHVIDVLLACRNIAQLDIAWPEHRKFISSMYYTVEKRLPALIVPNEKLRSIACSYVPGTCEEGTFKKPEDCGCPSASVEAGSVAIALGSDTMQAEVLNKVAGEQA